MKLKSNRIAILTVAACAALMIGVFAAATAVAQGTPADSGQPAKVISDSVKAVLQESAPVPAAAQPETKPAETAPDTSAAAPKSEETTPAAEQKSVPPVKTETKTDEEPKTVTPAKEEPKAQAASEDPTAPYKNIQFAKGEKPVVVMETSMGTITIELWPDVAPKHCQSFVYLINKGFYDSLTFHRIVPGFVIQGGDPVGNGTGGPGYNVPAEFSNKPHEDGILSMARAQSPNSAGSQFFICLGRLTNLDNQYTVFGKVIEGLDVVHNIEKTPSQGERPKTPVYMTKVSMKKAG